MQLEGWARDGLTNEQLAANMGITVKTFYEWQARFEQFREAIKKGKAPVDIEVENALLKRAKGYTYTETTEEIYTSGERDANGEYKITERHSRRVTKEVPPETAAAFIWLKNRRPDKWRDKREYVTDVTDNAFKNMQTIAALINNPEPDINIEDIAQQQGDDKP